MSLIDKKTEALFNDDCSQSKTDEKCAACNGAGQFLKRDAKGNVDGGYLCPHCNGDKMKKGAERFVKEYAGTMQRLADDKPSGWVSGLPDCSPETCGHSSLKPSVCEVCNDNPPAMPEYCDGCKRGQFKDGQKLCTCLQCTSAKDVCHPVAKPEPIGCGVCGYDIIDGECRCSVVAKPESKPDVKECKECKGTLKDQYGYECALCTNQKPDVKAVTEWDERYEDKWNYASFTWNGDNKTGRECAEGVRQDIKAFIAKEKALSKSEGRVEGYEQGWKARDDGDGTDYKNPYTEEKYAKQ